MAVATNGAITMRAVPGDDLPQRRGAGFLDLRVRREVFVGKHVVGRQHHDGVGVRRAGQIAKRLHHGQELFRGAVAVHHDDQRLQCGFEEQRVMQGARAGGEAGHTYPPRAALYLASCTLEIGRLLHVREEFANKRQDHYFFSLTG